jgi:hypothetical protein
VCIVVEIQAVGAVDTRAENAEIRAEIARTRAAEALAHADWDEVNGFPRAAWIHRREAAVHERAAIRQDQAAAIQRLHSALLRTTPARLFDEPIRG